MTVNLLERAKQGDTAAIQSITESISTARNMPANTIIAIGQALLDWEKDKERYAKFVRDEQPNYKAHVEIVTERMGDKVIASTHRPATEQEIKEEKEKYENTGNCEHKLMFDKDSWMYHQRHCYTCGAFLDLL